MSPQTGRGWRKSKIIESSVFFTPWKIWQTCILYLRPGKHISVVGGEGGRGKEGGGGGGSQGTCKCYYISQQQRGKGSRYIFQHKTTLYTQLFCCPSPLTSYSMMYVKGVLHSFQLLQSSIKLKYFYYQDLHTKISILFIPQLLLMRKF